MTTNRRSVFVRSWRWDDDEIASLAEARNGRFDGFSAGVALFNAGEYYACHDALEELWHGANEPQRGILHGILQCSVGLYHLLNMNHRGAMVELGEGVNKLRKLRGQTGPFYEFEQDSSRLLEFLYNTQLENAACSDDICVAMDGSEQSYRLLGNFGAGEPLYALWEDPFAVGEMYVRFKPLRDAEGTGGAEVQRVRVPMLRATEEDLLGLTQ
eukprot:TRINITY_DN38893_c0_g1_i1.p1 TRINITY_DN38893_c0_g1~~TRINITY_DN38893_c0_g1_i1.p1  ORF type:complete len:213 (-),score=25.14 TRINITY_DN38893_c0_g1_i1:158-796(-)